MRAGSVRPLAPLFPEENGYHLARREAIDQIYAWMERQAGEVALCPFWGRDGIQFLRGREKRDEQTFCRRRLGGAGIRFGKLCRAGVGSGGPRKKSVARACADPCR